MSAISAKDVMDLRKRTGLGMMECKKALSETAGDIEAAIELLRKTLKGQMDERTDRDAPEGAVAVARDGDAIAMVTLLAETDFAARNDGFVAAAAKIAELALGQPDGAVAADDAITAAVDDLRISIKENISLGEGVRCSGGPFGAYVHHDRKIGVIVQGEGELPDELLAGLAMHVAAAVPQPQAVDEAGLPAEEVEKHRQEAIEEAKASGKPEQIAEKIAGGKLKKWVDDHTLLGQVYLRELDAKKPVRDYLPQGAAVKAFVKYRLGA